MPETLRVFGHNERVVQDRNDTERRIIEATRKLFNEKGYVGMTLREVAKAVGIEAPSIYNYTSSKQELVHKMVKTHTNIHRAKVAAALEDAGPDATSRLHAAVRAHVLYYCEEKDMVAMTSSMPHIESPYREELVTVLKAYEDVFKGIIRDGMASGEFRQVDVTVVAFAIMGLGDSVLNWFHPGGRLSPEQVADEYAELAVRMVEVVSAG